MQQLSLRPKKNAVPREAVKKPVETKRVEIKKEAKPEIKKEVKKSGIEGAFAKIKKAPHKKSDSSDAKEEKPKVSEKINSKAVKKPAPINIANFFAKQTTKPKVEKTAIKEEKESKTRKILSTRELKMNQPMLQSRLLNLQRKSS